MIVISQQAAMNYITLHAADTYPDMDIGVAEITRWHTDRGWRQRDKPMVQK